LAAHAQKVIIAGSELQIQHRALKAHITRSGFKMQRRHASSVMPDRIAIKRAWLPSQVYALLDTFALAAQLPTHHLRS
jgi:hypothetical protein